jgi:hypothetical protein
MIGTNSFKILPTFKNSATEDALNGGNRLIQYRDFRGQYPLTDSHQRSCAPSIFPHMRKDSLS